MSLLGLFSVFGGILIIYFYAGLKALSKCSKLTILKLGLCLNLNDEGLRHIGTCCLKLMELDLYRFMTFHDSLANFKGLGPDPTSYSSFFFTSGVQQLLILAFWQSAMVALILK